MFVYLEQAHGDQNMNKVIISAVKEEDIAKIADLIESLIIAGFHVAIEPIKVDSNGDI